MEGTQKHRLLLELGRGGMGTVYLAVSRGPAGFSKLKVVKRLRADLANDEQFLTMFLDEARLTARLNHPNVVQTNEVGFDGANYFIEMEYLEGQSYDAIVRRAAKSGALPIELSLYVLSQALAGLHYAHELKDLTGRALRIVHRDVSPHNVFVTYDGAVKVLDFGIAKAADSSTDTTTGVVKGKVTYMAPEQAARGDIDRRVDVFAVGVMLWEALTGKRMWAGTPDFGIFLALQKGPPPSPRSVEPSVPEALDALCVKALAFAPGDRFATAKEMQLAIEEQLRGLTGRAGPGPLADRVMELFAERREAVAEEIATRMREIEEGSSASTRTSVDVPVLGQAARILETSTGPTNAGRPREAETRAARPSANERAAGESGDAERAAALSVGPERTKSAVISEIPRDPRRPRLRGRLGLAGTALAVLAVVGSATAWVTKRAATPAGLAPRAEATTKPECRTNAECTSAHAGRAAICRRDTHACAALDSDDCHPIATPAEVASDQTLWVGAMLPLSGPAGDSFGRVNANVLALARSDFAAVGGLPALAEDGPTRPLGLLQCDDAADYHRAAAHLVDVGVPAVIGFGTTSEALDLVPNVFLPKRILVLDMMSSSPLVTKIPQPKSAPRLVWRTTASAGQFGQALAHLISDWIEPKLREPGGSLHAGESLRVALVRSEGAHAFAIADGFVSSLRIDGKPLAEQASGFKQITFAAAGPSPADVAAKVAEIVRFAPHVIVYADSENFERPFLAPIEAAWTAGTKPLYASAGILASRELFDFVGRSAERRRRFFGVELPANTEANLKFVLHYNEAYQPPITPGTAPGVVYDTFYLLAFGAAAAPAAPAANVLTGSLVSQGLGRVRRDGTAIMVGPSRIFDGFSELAAGRAIDLVGAGSDDELDPATGEMPSDFAVYCLEPGDPVSAGSVESGLRFDHVKGRVEGTLRCK